MAVVIIVTPPPTDPDVVENPVIVPVGVNYQPAELARVLRDEADKIDKIHITQ